AMIDISDGLGAETHHICTASDVGAVLYADAIPVQLQVRAAADKLGADPLQWALSGGEDFELLFSIAPANVERLADMAEQVHEVGRVLPRSEGVTLLTADGESVHLPKGYDHFNPPVA
ncbi:MAG: thiamine-phosphate kinase, partial [Desulfatitalea sp.]|nr:thiamine-phosphate kinase [Desulfatitalea sp.]